MSSFIERFMCLYKLAEKKELPNFQKMDTETVLWIERNKPDFSQAEKIVIEEKDFLINFIEKSVVKERWFEDIRIYEGIHGLSHLLRVTVNGFLLSRHARFSKEFRTGLMVAALFHDIKRVNDQEDRGHGKRSAEWLKENQEIIFELFGFSIEKETWKNALKAINYHEENYENIPHEDRNDDFVNLLKAADALDRYRLPKMNWWINDKFLAIKPKPEEKNFAFDMVTFTERELLEEKSYRETVIKYIEKYAGK